MPTYRQGDIVRVPFPYTDRNTRQHRPAVVVSDGPVGDQDAFILVAMITSARNRPWLGDCAIEDYIAAGLPKPSVVRPCKVTTVELRHAELIGRLPEELSRQVVDTVAGLIGR